MRAAAREAFVPMTVAFEGGWSINWMFPDVKGLVSTGYGLLLDPVALALGLPWRRDDGALASREEIVADWARVKNYPDAARLGHLSVKGVARLRLDREGMEQAFTGKILQNEAILRRYFSDYDNWCADAQLAVHSMAWAVGPAFPDAGWPKLTKALRARDWTMASVECFLPEERTISGLRPRNKANKTLFLNAAAVEQQGMNPEALFYPRDLIALELDDEAETLPELPSSEKEPPSVIVTQPIVHSLHIAGLPGVGNDDEPPDAA